ncbi:MAG: cell division protein FtsQ [Prevotellaceae bacterium]|nr:cell division protein FtsQ [Prevotellaceae bacterium]
MNKLKKSGILILLVLLVSYTVFALFKFSHNDENQVCRRVLITVKDSEQFNFVDTTEVHAVLVKNRVKLRGQKLSTINTKRVENLLEQNAAIRKVVCYKTASGDIGIDVWQREPLFRVLGKQNYFVDMEGKTIPASPNFVIPVAVVTGNVNKNFACGKLREFVLFLHENDFWNAQIVQIDVQSENEIVLIPRIGNHEIEFGNLDNYQQKLAKLKTFYLEGLNKIGWGDFSKISLKYKDQVIGTKK